MLDQCHPEEDGGVDLLYTGGNVGRCSLWNEDSCPFGGIVYKGNTEVWEEDCSGEYRNDDDMESGASGSIKYYGVESRTSTNIVFGLRNFAGGNNGHKPTTGFHAVITFALACRSLRLYGFAGETSLDGHEIMASHGIQEEHDVLNQLLDPARAVTLNEMARNDEFRGAWAAANVSLVC